MQAPINYFFFFSMGSHEFVLSEGCFIQASYYTGLPGLTGKCLFCLLFCIYFCPPPISKLLEVTILKEILSSLVLPD